MSGFSNENTDGGHVKRHAGLRLSCHFRVDLLSFCVDEEQTRQTSVKGSPAEAASLGWCFVQMCSVVEGHILCWQIGGLSVHSSVLTKACRSARRGSLVVA